MIKSQMNQEFISYAKYGKPHVIGVYKGQPVPIPNGDEVRVKVLASSVCYTDTLMRRNLYTEQPKLPIIPGYDICGTVDAVGDRVTRLKVGDLVCDLVVYGGNTRYMIRPETSLVKIPENTDPDQAAALTLSWVTAYQALFRPTKLVFNGTKVLITGGTGAVGQALIKLVRHYGGKTYVTADSKDTAVLKELGADIILPKQSHYWLPKVYGEMDVVVDTVCEDYFKSSAKALKKDGHLVVVGMTHFLNKGSTWKAWWAQTRLKFMKNTSVYHIQQYRKEHPDHFVQDLTELCDLLNKGEIKVKIDKLIGFEEVAKYHELLENGGVLKGKVILKPWRNFEATSTVQ